MKIAYILTTFPAISETFAAREIKGLIALGHDVVVLAAASTAGSPSIPHDVPVYYRPPAVSFKTLISIAFLIRRHPLSIFIYFFMLLRVAFASRRDAGTLLGNFHTLAFFSHMLEAHGVSALHAYFLSWPACIALALSRMTGCRFSIAAHARDIFVEPGAVLLKAEQAEFIVTCSAQGYAHLQSMLPHRFHDKLHIIHHGVAFADYNIGPREPGQLIAIGRLVPKKGFDVLLAAFAKVALQVPHHRLVIVGDGPELPRLQRMITALGIDSRVQLLGRKDPDETMALLRRSEVLVVPSVVAEDRDRDGIPNVILEAFSTGVSVIASRLEGISEAITHGDNGLLVEPGDSEALARAILDMVNDRTLANTFGHNGNRVGQSKFNVAQNVPKLADLLTRTYQRRQPRIVHVSEPLTGGIATHLKHILPALATHGFDVTLVCPDTSDPRSRTLLHDLADQDIRIRPIPMTKEIRPMRDLWSLVAICRFLLADGCDIVHTHSSKAGAIGRLAAFLTGIDTILHTPHCFAFLRREAGLRRTLYLQFERLLARLTTCFVAVSHSEAKAALMLGGRHDPECKVVFNALPQSNSPGRRLERVPLDIPENSLVVSTVCRVVEGKGIFRFLETAKLSRAENTRFLIVGEGSLEACAHRFVHRHNLGQKVLLPGFMDDPDAAYAISDVVVLCSDAEGQPYALLEAMRAKCAIVATNVPGNSDLIRHETTGLLCSRDPRDLAHAIDRLLTDKALRLRLAYNAHEYFLRHHLLTEQIVKLTGIYESLSHRHEWKSDAQPISTAY